MPLYNVKDLPNTVNEPPSATVNNQPTPNTASAPMPRQRKTMRPGQAMTFADWMKPSQAKAFKAGQDMSDPRAAYNAWLQMVTGGAIGGGGGRRGGTGRGGGGGAPGAAGPGGGGKPWQNPAAGTNPARNVDKPGGGLTFQPGDPLTQEPPPWDQALDRGGLKSSMGGSGIPRGGAPDIRQLLQILLGGGAEQGRGMGAKG